MASNNKHLVVKYFECMHNHAARSMGHVLDGCGEFCPTGAHETPEFFICAACHCHRSFHRKMEVEAVSGVEFPIHGTPLAIIDGPLTSPPQRCLARPRQLHMKMCKGETQLANQSNFNKRKRSTTTTSSVRMRLNTNQKKRVLIFVKEVMGWRWTKWNNQVIPFCAEIGITTEFLKNWINNNSRRIGPLKKPSKENESVA